MSQRWRQHTYTAIALAVLAGPLAFSFEPQVHFWTHWASVWLAALLVGVPFVVWDIVVVHQGHWAFNPDWTGTLRWWGLPLGEYLFFITVPYAMLFSYEAFAALWPDTTWFDSSPAVLFGLAGLVLVAAGVWRRQGYTLLALTSTAVFLLVTAVFKPSLVGTSAFWIYLGFGFVAFAVVNGIYTALPTIHYAPRAIWGVRVGTIPLEDFFYNLSFLGLLLVAYLALKGVWS